MKKLINIITTAALCLIMSTTVLAHEYAMSFLYGGTTTQYNNYVESTDNVLNSVSPDYFEINSDGSLYYPKLNREFIESMHGRGIKVIPFISNHWDKSLGIAALNNTEKLTNEIANVIDDYELDGINVDIENVSHLQRDAYSNFVKVLREKMPNKIITVSVAANPNNWQTGWHGSYDYEKLARYSDYLMIMGYDESYYGGPAGPVSSANFAEKSIIYALNYTTPDKIVFGLPFYGRYWIEGEAVGGNGITSVDINNLLKNYQTTKIYHEDTQSAQVFLTLTKDDVMPKLWGGKVLTPGNYEIWYDDIQATKYKLDLVDKYHLRGSGSWALGQDDKQVWAEYANYKTSNIPKFEPESETTPETIPSPEPSQQPKSRQRLEQKREQGKKTITRSWFSEEIIEGNDSSITIEAMKIKIKSGKGSDSTKNNNLGNENENTDRNPANREKQNIRGIQNTGGISTANENQNTVLNPTAYGNQNMSEAGTTYGNTNTGGTSNAYGNQSMSGIPAAYNNQNMSGIQNTGAFQGGTGIQGVTGNSASYSNTNMGGTGAAYGNANTGGTGAAYGDTNTGGAGAIYGNTNTAEVGASYGTGTANISATTTTYGNTNIGGTGTTYGNTNMGGTGTAYGNTNAGGTGATYSNTNMSGTTTTYGNRNNSINQSNQGNQANNINQQGRGYQADTITQNDNVVTKAQAIKMIMQLASKLPEPTEKVTDFKDTASHDSKEYISKARYYGIIDKNRMNQFHPDRAITKLELILLIDRVFNLPDTVDFESGKVKDVDKRRNSEAYYAVNKYLEHEVISVDNQGKFYPDSTITMGEMNKIMEKLEGAGIKELQPVMYPGQKQKNKILEPR